MFASAARPYPEALRLLRLALTLAKTTGDVPGHLVTQLRLIFEQAESIVSNPTIVKPTFRPEAVELAVELRRSPEFLDVLKRTLYDGLTGQDAERELSRVEMKLAHFN